MNFACFLLFLPKQSQVKKHAKTVESVVQMSVGKIISAGAPLPSEPPALAFFILVRTRGALSVFRYLLTTVIA